MLNRALVPNEKVYPLQKPIFPASILIFLVFFSLDRILSFRNHGVAPTEDSITEELFRMDLLAPNTSGNNPNGAHNGPRSVDTEIASILYLASNPYWIQGDVLELSCAGTAGASGVSLSHEGASSAIFSLSIYV